MKASKTQILPSKEQQAANHRLSTLEVTEVDSVIMDDQMQIEEENQVSYRPRATAAPPQLPTISGISEKDRARIASKKEEAPTKTPSKEESQLGESGQVECVKHKKQKHQHREMIPTPEK